MHTPLIRSTTHDVQTSSTGSSVPGTGSAIRRRIGAASGPCTGGGPNAALATMRMETSAFLCAPRSVCMAAVSPRIPATVSLDGEALTVPVAVTASTGVPTAATGVSVRTAPCATLSPAPAYAPPASEAGAVRNSARPVLTARAASCSVSATTALAATRALASASVHQATLAFTVRSCAPLGAMELTVSYAAPARTEAPATTSLASVPVLQAGREQCVPSPAHQGPLARTVVRTVPATTEASVTM